MSETSNIAKMAAKLSAEVFGVFGWTRVGPADINWPCTESAHDCKTHPTDVVFWYDDPYQGERVYINFDLKSYSAATLQKSKITKALISLAASVECANSGEHWREKYVDTDVNWHCDGALFVYNHDHGYDKSFRTLFEEATTAIKVPKGRRLCVFGPPEIEYLYNIATDILTLKGMGELPAGKESEFWYPDLVTARRHTQQRSAASVEMLTSPWIAIRAAAAAPRFFLWYKSGGATSTDHFKYLLDFVFRYQVLASDEASVVVRLVGADSNAMSNFSIAKEQYSRMMHLDPSRLRNVTASNVSTARPVFDQTEIGME